MNDWERLVEQAIGGTGRNPEPLSVSTPAVSKLLPQLRAFDPETQFLHTAALLTQYRAAGLMLPQGKAAQITPCPADIRTVAAERAAAYLLQVLQQADLKLIGEWLTHAIARQWRVPVELWPALLDLARQQRQLLPALEPCLDERARWLMALNPTWQLAEVQKLQETDWHEGYMQARLRFLEALRQAAPDQARELLAASWAQEPAKERAALLAKLQINLAAADASFLENCLNDRSEHVRTEAARLLCRLPDSALLKSLLAEISGYIQFKKGWLGKKLEIKLPDSFQTTWARLGIKEKGDSEAGIGQKAGWLVQLLAFVSPTAFARHQQVVIDELIRHTLSSDFADALWRGWLEGAATYGDHEFILAYLQAMGDQGFLTAFAPNAHLLPPPVREDCLQAYLVRRAEQALPDWENMEAVLVCFDQLSPALSTHLLCQHWPRLLAGGQNGYVLNRVFNRAAYQFAPACYPQAVALFQGLEAQRTDQIDKFLSIYQFRYQMAEAFQP
ncbi:MAG: DUF5691 domain-containing protein [Caldilineaceae bacterium]